MDANIQAAVLHYKKKLEKDFDQDRILDVFKKLRRIRITVSVLESTGIGKVVNGYRKADGLIGEEARALVRKWKALVETETPEDYEPVEEQSSVCNKRSSYLADLSESFKLTKKPVNENSRQIEKKIEDSHVNSVVEHKAHSRSSKCKDKERNHSKHHHKEKHKHKEKHSVKHSKAAESDSRLKHESGRGKSSNCAVKQTGELDDSASSMRILCKNQPSKRETLERVSDDTGGSEKKGLFSFADALSYNTARKTKKASKHSKSERKKSSSAHKKKRDSSSEKEHTHGKNSSYLEGFEVPQAVSKTNQNEVNVDATLPDIQPNYKPMHYPTLYEEPHRKKSGTFDDNYFIGSKKTKTQLYSGRRNAHFYSAVPRLFDACIRILIDNIDSIDYLGNIPFDIVQPVLERCTPSQLYTLEDFNPYLLEDTDDLWKSHCNKEFKFREPEDMESWRELYLRLHDERETKLRNITANISAQMAKQNPVRTAKLAYVDGVAKPPRDVRRKQIKHGTAGAAWLPHEEPKTVAEKAHPVKRSKKEPPASASPRKKEKKTLAPMMQKTLKMLKNRFRR